MGINSDVLKQRTKQFAHRCIKLATALPGTSLGRHIRNQLIRSATSVGANYRAATVAQTRKTFTSKISIVVEEADESAFWLELAIGEELIDKTRAAPLLQEANELTAIFIATRKTAQSRRPSKSKTLDFQ